MSVLCCAALQGGLGGLAYPLVADITKSISKDYGVLIEEGERGLQESPAAEEPRWEELLSLDGERAPSGSRLQPTSI